MLYQIETDFSPFQSLNLLPIYIRLEHLKLTYYILISIFSKYSLKQAQFVPFSYLHMYQGSSI